MLKRDDILKTFEGLSRSQGLYGRLLRQLYDMKENDPDAYERYMQELEDQEFKDELDLIMYIEE